MHPFDEGAFCFQRHGRLADPPATSRGRRERVANVGFRIGNLSTFETTLEVRVGLKPKRL